MWRAINHTTPFLILTETPCHHHRQAIGFAGTIYGKPQQETGKSSVKTGKPLRLGNISSDKDRYGCTRVPTCGRPCGASAARLGFFGVMVGRGNHDWGSFITNHD